MSDRYVVVKNEDGYAVTLGARILTKHRDAKAARETAERLMLATRAAGRDATMADLADPPATSELE